MINEVKNKLEEWLPGLHHFLNRRTVVTGGFVRDVVVGDEPRDLDIFVRDDMDALYIASFCKSQKLQRTHEYQILSLGQYPERIIGSKIQIIVCHRDVLMHIKIAFNFRCNCIAYVGDRGLIEVVPGAFMDCHSKSLVINNGNDTPALKLESYQKRGWNLEQ